MSGYAHPQALVETDRLAERASDTNVRALQVGADTAAGAGQ